MGKRINELNEEEKEQLMEMFKNDNEVREDNFWSYLNGLSICSGCGKPYPICKGWHE